ncbi:MAG: heme lyase CcmF/NrfE family subunit [Anaerolineae bacterium]|nr:heme lyase CcmF/NrfE family subunit [Anaerolineae bacterium]MDW8099170.1 heme lyase CcmF/NrfE family subunit [Anaerolineae bacterium]
MIPDIGYVALVLGFVIALFGVAVSIEGARRRMPELVMSGRNAVFVVGSLVVIATLALWYALLTDDFSIEYVASHSERNLPTLYKISSLWGGQAGSLLFWTLILSLYSMAVAARFHQQHQQMMPYVHATLLFTSAFFLSLLLFSANPFQRLPFRPPDGSGLNPLLQNYWMMAHPVGLYLGFVGFTVPFAFAVAALASRQLGNAWVRTIRRWTLVPWLFLSVGILMGSQWAYAELGWGGYWAWDPVENASLLPWLTGTAFLHSIMIQERRGMFKTWNMALILLTFELTLTGTFITRSGIIESVHSFALSNIGPMFLAFIAASTLGFLALMHHRMPLLRSENELDGMLSREAGFLGNNLILVGITFTTLLGTLFPIITEAVSNTKISVSAPFFNKVNGPIFLGLLVLMGICPLLGWRISTWETIRRQFTWPAILSLAGVAALAIFGVREPLPLVGLGVCALIMSTIGQEFVRGTDARRKTTGESWLQAMIKLVRRNQRRYGGYTVHLGVVLMAIGIIGNTFYQSEGQANLAIGEHMTVKDYTLVYRGLGQRVTPNHQQIYARLEIYRNGRYIGTLEPQRNIYFKTPEQPTSEVGILTGLREDVYAVLAGWEDNGARASFKVYINPLMIWLWIGGLVLVLGTVIAIWPHRQEPASILARAPARAIHPA